MECLWVCQRQISNVDISMDLEMELETENPIYRKTAVPKLAELEIQKIKN